MTTWICPSRTFVAIWSPLLKGCITRILMPYFFGRENQFVWQLILGRKVVYALSCYHTHKFLKWFEYFLGSNKNNRYKMLKSFKINYHIIIINVQFSLQIKSTTHKTDSQNSRTTASVAESCTICSSRSRRPVRKLLDTHSYSNVWTAIAS